MAEFPALPLFTDSYLGDTTHLSTFEHGAYLLLLIISWRAPGCRLPDDDRLLARYSKMTLDKWRKTRPMLEPFFRIESGYWQQARLQDEFQHLQSQRAVRSEAGKAGNAAKSLKRANRDLANAGRLRTQSNGKPDAPIPTPITEDKSSDGKPSNLDPVKELFDIGVHLLASAGKTESQARSIIGKWRKDNSDADVLAGLIHCRCNAISDPVEFLTKRFEASPYVSPTGHRYRGDEREVMREAERRADWGTYWKAKGALERSKKRTASGG